jgi:hypothetical protein
MNESHAHSRKPADIATANVPMMPRLAEKAAHDLERPIKAICDALRAFEAWFEQYGDPFAAVEAPAFAETVNRHQDAFDEVSNTLCNAELLARLRSTFHALSVRLKAAGREERM